MLSIDVIKTRRNLAEIGIAMVPLSMALGMMAKLLLGNMLIGNAIMIVGLLMAFPIHRFKYGFHFGRLAGCVAFILISFLYYFVSDFNTPVYLLYLGVVFVYALELSMLQPVEDVRIEKCIYWLWVLSLLCVICGYLCFITGLVNVLEGAFKFNDEGDAIYDGLTMGNIGVIQIACSCFFLATYKENKKYSTLLFIIILIDFIIIFMAFKRTPIVVALFVFLYYMKNLGYLKPTPKKVIVISVLLLSIVVYVFMTPEVYDAIVFMFDEIINGVVSLLTGSHSGHGLTNSTDMRLDHRQHAFELLSNFDMLNCMIGKGFMTFWFDMPLVQSFLDMGLLGASLYFYYIVVLPLVMILTKKRHNSILFFFGMLAIYGTLCSMTSGRPYDHDHWEMTCLLCFAINYESIVSAAMMIQEDCRIGKNE